MNLDTDPGAEAYLDDLCCQMLQLGAFADGTRGMTGAAIISHLAPFFGRDRIDRVLAKFNNEETV